VSHYVTKYCQTRKGFSTCMQLVALNARARTHAHTHTHLLEPGFVWHLLCCVRYSVVPFNSSLLTITLILSHYLGRATLVYNNTKYSVPFVTFWPNLTVHICTICICTCQSQWLSSRKVRVCGQSHAGIVGLVPAGGMDVFVLWVVCITR
jgi:hypothetical protein